MKKRPIELSVMFIGLLVANWVAMFVLQGSSAPAAWANGLAGLLAAPQAATIPRTFSYQGTLRLADGSLADGAYTLTVRIYKEVTGGTALHTEQFADVAVRGGLFSIVVGDVTPIAATVFDNTPLFLGIAVNPDPEMLPRQRLHPVPWAMQASSAQTAVTANNLVAGGGVSGVVTFGAGGAKEIAFNGGGKITDSPTGMTITGAGANGAVTIGGDLTINGDWSAEATRDIGDSNAGQNQRSTYPVSLNRYVVEALDQGASPDTVPIDDALLVELCQDEDGCTFTLGMRDWEPTHENNGYKGVIASAGPFRFSMTNTIANKRLWDARTELGGHPGGSAGSAYDGDATGQHVAQAWSCYFSDSAYVNGVHQNDGSLGFHLLNWFGLFDSTDMVCVLIIED